MLSLPAADDVILSCSRRERRRVSVTGGLRMSAAASSVTRSNMSRNAKWSCDVSTLAVTSSSAGSCFTTGGAVGSAAGVIGAYRSSSPSSSLEMNRRDPDATTLNTADVVVAHKGADVTGGASSTITSCSVAGGADDTDALARAVVWGSSDISKFSNAGSVSTWRMISR